MAARSMGARGGWEVLLGSVGGLVVHAGVTNDDTLIIIYACRLSAATAGLLICFCAHVARWNGRLDWEGASAVGMAKCHC
jgi:hypothetical protein